MCSKFSGLNIKLDTTFELPETTGRMKLGQSEITLNDSSWWRQNGGGRGGAGAGEDILWASDVWRLILEKSIDG